MPVRVGERMVRDPLTLSEGDFLRDAVDLAMRRKIRHLPVVDAGGTLVGIVTDRDIKRALPSPLQTMDRSEYESLLSETPIVRVMTREPIVVGPDDTIADAVRLMVEKTIGGLPVVSDGALVGIFTQTDALKVFLEMAERD